MIENFDYYVDSVVPLRVEGKLLVDMSGPQYHRVNGYADIPFLFPSLEAAGYEVSTRVQGGESAALIEAVAKYL
jgi:hypothetical protein